MAKCSKCGAKIGFLSGAIVGGKDFCNSCHSKLTEQDRISMGAYECRECAYFYVDSDYESFCKKNNFAVDRNKKCCDNFQKY